MHFGIFDRMVPPRLGDVAAVEPDTPTHQVTIWDRHTQKLFVNFAHLGKSPHAEFRIGFLFGTPLLGHPTDRLSDVLRCLLITMISASQLIALKRHAMALVCSRDHEPKVSVIIR